MRAVRTLVFCLMAALTAALYVSPLPAQSASGGKKARAEHAATRPELQKRPGGQVKQTRQQDHRAVQVRNARQAQRHVPPGWCIGRGNPHNTPENCGPHARSIGLNHDYRHYDRASHRRLSGSERQHHEFHRQLERECRQQLARRPSDRSWQRRVHAECEQRHERWHVRNDPRFLHSR